MRHRHRPSLAYLLLEDGDHRAVGAEHVAEAGGDELGVSLHLTFLDCLVEALHVYLADALRAAHHVGWVDSLVGRYHHELPRAVSHRQVGDDLCSMDVVYHALVGIVLHHRHMLVCGRVEDIVGTVFVEYTFHHAHICDVRHNSFRSNLRPVVAHHEPDVMHRRLGLVDEYKVRRIVSRHLADDLGAYRARRTGDHHHLPLQQVGRSLHVHLDLLTGQQILHIHRMQFTCVEVGLPVPFPGLRDDQDFYTVLDEGVDQRLAVAQTVHQQRRDYQCRCPVPAHRLRKTAVERMDPHAHESAVPQVIPVRHEACYLIGGVCRRANALGQGHAPLAYTEDERLAAVGHLERILVEGLDPYAHRPHERHGEQTHQNHVRRTESEQPVGRGERPLHDEDEHDRGNDCPADPQQVGERREAYNPLVGMEKPETDDEAYEKCPERPHQGCENLRGLRRAVMDGICQQSGEHDEKAVYEKDAPVRERAPGEIPGRQGFE